VTAADGNGKVADNMTHTEDSVVVRDMSVCPTLKMTLTDKNSAFRVS